MTYDAEHAVRQLGELMSLNAWSELRGLLGDEFIDHSAPPGTPPGPDAYVATLRWVAEDLGIAYTTEAVVGDGRAVAVRATAHGVDTDGAFGFAPTGKTFAMATMHWYESDGATLVGHWGVLDQLGRLAQVGAIPVGKPS